MRLLNVTTLELESFADDQIPSYAILSHTWDTSPANEVSIHDILSHGAVVDTTAPPARKSDAQDKDTDIPPKKPGWAKIKGACATALARNCHYIWIDTCCIDKSSSAELQESINSMFRWYANATICLAFLSDVAVNFAHFTNLCQNEIEEESDDVAVGDGIVPASYSNNTSDSALRNARWFTRGWTLQELLAPATVEFFSQDWESLGTKESLSGLIQDITGIPSQYLTSGPNVDSITATWGVGNGNEDRHRLLSRASVAERMSWAANRQTTRVEDTAYCLLGLFGVSMPMLYGEGGRAFARLQREIMKESDDCTALSWGYGQPWNDRADAGTILAPNPAGFRHCGGLVPKNLGGNFGRPRFSLGQQGLTLSLPIKDDRNYHLMVYAVLACGPRSASGLSSLDSPSKSESDYLVAIPLISVSACDHPSGTIWKEPNEYLRYSWCTPVVVPSNFLSGADTRTIVIRRPSPIYESLLNLPIQIKAPRDYVLVETYPPQPTYPVIGTCVVDLGRNIGSSFHTRRAEDDVGSSGGSSSQQRLHRQMMHIKTESLGDLLVSISLTITQAPATADQGTAGSSQKEDTCVRCQVFKLPSRHFDLQLLHDWAYTRAAGDMDADSDVVATVAAQHGLEEIAGVARSDMSTIFRVKGRNRSVLAVQIKQIPGDGRGTGAGAMGFGTATSMISIFEDEDWGGA